ncbi:MAG: adenylate/guanylate cyclase domain-containing protein [Myxococcales bacterium]
MFIRCLDCAAENAATARFCNQCGVSLLVPCRVCGHSNPVGLTQCISCKVALARATPRARDRDEAERRQLTVVFSDLVGSTAMARQLENEDFRDLLNEYQAICREVVLDLGGHVAQYLGDGVLIYFGFPEAHEDDPRRAAEAALRILDKMRSMGDRLALGVRFSPEVRVGIHTGVVIVGRVGDGHEHLALGEAPNLAARLQQLAAPNAIIVSDATRRLIEGHFELDLIGDVTLKGFEEPITVHHLLASTSVQSRGAASIRLPSPIGRAREESALLEQWLNVTRNLTPRAVLLSGEPGIGKSRQAQTLKQGLRGRCQLFEGYCSPLHQNTVLHPIVHALETAAELAAFSEPAQKAARLQEYLEALGLEAELASLLAPVLSLPLPEGLAPPALTPQIKRQRTMQALVSVVCAMAKNAPLLFLVEDLHWADPSTLEFLTTYVTTQHEAPVLLVATCRPEFTAPWPDNASTSIGLQRLAPEQADEVILRVAQGPLPATVRDRIVDLSDGVPLFLEEVTKAILESGALRHTPNGYEISSALPESAIPATVHDSLMARLDRMGESKAVAQLAATIGREFSHDVLHAVSLMDEATLNVALRHLVESGLIIADDDSGTRVYRFKHALIQETAYQSLLRERRRQYHHRVASVLRDQFTHVADAQPDVVALHHAKANLPELAANFFEKAGSSALEAQAYAESINHFRSALEQLQKLGAGKGRDGRELGALAALGLPLLMTKGYAAAEVEDTYERALHLCTEVDPPLRILFGIWGVQIARGDRTSTDRMAAQFEQIAKSTHSPGERLISLAAVGSHAFWSGEFDKANRALEGAVAEFKPEMLVSLQRDYGYDNAMYPYLYLAWSKYLSGRLAEGAATWEEVRLATERANAPYFLVMTLSFGAAIFRDLGDAEKALELSERGMALALEHQLLFWLALAQMQHGSAQCLLSNLGPGIALIEQGMQLFRAIGAMTPLPYYLGYLADAYLRLGATDKGLAAVEEGIQLAAVNVDRSSLVELLRLKAELSLQAQDTAGASACFEESLTVARAQGSGLLELRSATSYARFCLERGQLGRARELLDMSLGRVTGGEPPIVQAALELRAKLRSAPADDPARELAHEL